MSLIKGSRLNFLGIFFHLFCQLIWKYVCCGFIPPDIMICLSTQIFQPSIYSPWTRHATTEGSLGCRPQEMMRIIIELESNKITKIPVIFLTILNLKNIVPRHILFKRCLMCPFCRLDLCPQKFLVVYLMNLCSQTTYNMENKIPVNAILWIIV